MPVQVVLFDVGDVLEIIPADHWIDRWVARLGRPRDELIAALGAAWGPGRTGAITYDDVEQGTAEVLGTDLDEARVMLDDMWDWYLGTWNDELADYAAALRPRYVTAVLSNSFVGAREREHDRYRLGDQFDPILYSHEEGLEKPDPAFYALACERLETAAAEVVFVDDLAENVEAAVAFGMRAVQHRDNATTIATIEHHLRS